MFDADPAKGKEQVHSTVQKHAEHNFNLVLLWVTSDYRPKEKSQCELGFLGRSAARRPLCHPGRYQRTCRLFRPTATPRIARSVALLSISRSPSSQ